MLRRPLTTALVALCAITPLRAHAEAQADRFSAGGYLRVNTRPDFQGGYSRLGYWNLYGRLLNEGQWAALEMKLDLLQAQADSDKPWTSLRAKIEGDSVLTTDVNRGALSNYKATQLYVQAGNILLKDVTWQIGTLDTYYGNLGLYDMKPAQLLFETIGISGRYQSKHIDFLAGFGDSGFFMRGATYNAILTGAASLKLKLGDGRFEVGLGGQFGYEPEVKDNPNALFTTPGLRYEDFWRREVVRTYAEQETVPSRRPERITELANTAVRPSSALSYKAIGYLGFGNLGPLRWNNLFANFQKRHPDHSYFENYDGRTVQIFVKDLTDERYQINVGNEAYFTLIPGKLDLVWAALFGYHWDKDNTIAASEDNRQFVSTVVRLQQYLTERVHLLAETSLARETSLNGNMFRNHADSVFKNRGGIKDDEKGLEYGDSPTRDTWQLKLGPVINPLGTGIWSRPSLRLLYGLQYSSQNTAFGNSFSTDQGQNQKFVPVEQHWHHVVAVEAEAWF